MDVREKLVELLNKQKGMTLPIWTASQTVELMADALITHGVTVQDGEDRNVPTKWISVKDERKPDLELVEAKANDFDLYACLVTIKNERARDGRYVGKAWYDGEGFMDGDCVDITYEVTHWMSLPEPPKGE